MYTIAVKNDFKLIVIWIPSEECNCDFNNLENWLFFWLKNYVKKKRGC